MGFIGVVPGNVPVMNTQVTVNNTITVYTHVMTHRILWSEHVTYTHRCVKETGALAIYEHLSAYNTQERGKIVQCLPSR